MKNVRSNKPLIGCREYVSFPEWEIKDVRAKVDTGALSSAIDVSDYEELPRNRVRFHVVLSRTNRSRKRTVEAKIVRRAKIRSSFGKMQERIIVSTPMVIGEHSREIELGLVCRKNMICRMLIGRQALGHDFIIDPARRYLLTKKEKTTKK